MMDTPNESLSKDMLKAARDGSSTNEQLMEMEKVPNTPFTIVKYNDHWFLTMGKYRLSEPQTDKQTVIESAYDTTWDRLLQVIKIMIDESK